MSDQRLPGRPPQNSNEPGWMSMHKSGIMLILSWLAPFIILAIGYMLFPPLRAHVTSPWRAPIEIWLGIVVQLVLLIIWILYEIWYTTQRNTSVTQLQIDFVGDLITTLILLSLFVGSFRDGTLQWWLIVPFIGALIDVFQSGLLGINNAAEKPYQSPKGST